MTNGATEIFDDVDEFVRLANQNKYHFMCFNPEELCEIENEEGGRDGEEIVVVYSKEKFNQSEAVKFLKEFDEATRNKD